MTDITKCTGDGRPIKESCYRYFVPENDNWQSYFTAIPGDYTEEVKNFDDPKHNTRTLIWKCEMFWGVQSQEIYDKRRT